MYKPLTRLTLATLAALVMSTSAACGQLPAGTDGELANQWPAMAAPDPWLPRADACLNRFPFSLTMDGYREVACTAPHEFQTVYVGEINGDAAKQAQAPATMPAPLWKDCDSRLTAFLGGPWRDRKVQPLLAVPSAAAWEGGSRWYVCGTRVINDTTNAERIMTVSLRDGFNTLTALKFGCYDLAEGATIASPKRCDEPHNTEFAGHFLWGNTSYADMKKELDKVVDEGYRRCRQVVSTFAGVPNVRTGTWVWKPTEEAWNAGDRTMRCFLWLDKTKVSKSLKGVGAGAWPIK